MCIVLLTPGVNPIAVNKFIITYQIGPATFRLVTHCLNLLHHCVPLLAVCELNFIKRNAAFNVLKVDSYFSENTSSLLHTSIG
jgi:hypothetical protein